MVGYSGPRLVYKFRADAAYYRTIIDRYYGQRVFLLRLPVQYGIVSLAIVGAFLGYKGYLREPHSEWALSPSSS